MNNDNNLNVEVKKETKKKKDIRSILLILLFVFLFAFIMGMPYINEFIDNIKKDVGMSKIERQAKQIEQQQNAQAKKKTSNKTNEPAEKLNKLTCTKSAVALEDYDKAVVEVFEYDSKNQVKISSVETTYTFTEQNVTYENLKTECNENSLKYIDHKGYTVGCSYNDTEVVMSDKFDLSTYKTIKTATSTITANAKYKESIDAVKKRLTKLGYTCK